MTDYSDLIPYLAVELPSCPDNIITQMLKIVARDFCLKTFAWWEDLEPVDIVADAASYTLKPPASGIDLTLVTWCNGCAEGASVSGNVLTCGATDTTVAATWAALAATGKFSLILDGAVTAIAPDFTADASMANVAASLQTAVQAATGGSETVAYDTDHLVITGVGHTRIGFLTTTSDYVLERVSGVELDDSGLLTSQYAVTNDYRGWQLTLDATPSAASTDGLEITAVLTPKLTATSMPQSIMDRYGMDICSGVKWHLMRQPRKPWSDPASAMDYRQEYWNAVAIARVNTTQGQKSTRLRVKMRSFI